MDDILGGVTRDDMNTDKHLFDKGEVVKFVCVDFRRDENKKHIFLKCKILSGIHKDKDYSMMIPGGDHEMEKKKRASFFYKSGFWSDAELDAKKIELRRLTGRMFQAKAAAVKEHNGEKFQDMNDIKDLGPADPSMVASPAAASAAQSTSF